MRRTEVAALFVALLGFGGVAPAEEVKLKEIARRIPPVGIELPKVEREKIEAGLAEATAAFGEVKDHALAPDAEIFLKAVRYALLHGEFYGKGDAAKMLKLLEVAKGRIAALKEGGAPWTKQRGFVVRGYRSEIDGSAQPYGLEIPEGLDLSESNPLYVWLHGRGDKVTDAHFIAQRMEKPGKFKIENGIVVHPFGRQCIGWKSAGEIDVLDVVETVDENYGIDRDRVALMGFSMGGAGAWHIGAHYPDRWCVVHAGAGFAETAEYTRLKKEDYPSETEQMMWRIYDVPNYARNLLNLPVIAYSGEEDKQIQAARVMERAMREQGFVLPHVIGKGMGHKYDEASQEVILKFIGAAVEKGVDRKKKEIDIQTRTLRYPSVHWAKITGMVEPYGDTQVAGTVFNGTVSLTTRNVSALELSLPDVGSGFLVEVDGHQVAKTKTGREKISVVRGEDGKWAVGQPAKGNKRPGLQGPIDDAFTGPFLLVTPDAKRSDSALGRWVNFEVTRFERRWRELFRGDLRIKPCSGGDRRRRCQISPRGFWRCGEQRDHPPRAGGQGIRRSVRVGRREAPAPGKGLRWQTSGAAFDPAEPVESGQIHRPQQRADVPGKPRPDKFATEPETRGLGGDRFADAAGW